MDLSSSQPPPHPPSHLQASLSYRSNSNQGLNAASAPNNHQNYLAEDDAEQGQGRGRFTEEWDASQRGTSIVDGQHGGGSMHRSPSAHSYRSGDDGQFQQEKLSRGNTLKKKSSMRRQSSLGRSASRRSARAGSVRSLALNSASEPDEANSAFYCPVPTSGNPTEVLTTRFQSWRKVLKDLIAYFREIQNHYESRSKNLLKLANVSNNISTPPGFLNSGGIDDALQILRAYNKNAILEANKAKDIEEDVILALTGLRSDLQQKIKEIKNLSGDFKNSVQKEMDNTSKAVQALQNVLGKAEIDSASTTGKQDPFLLRLAVDRQIERQLDEENYLHQAYLNLESSGRELESIVVGEIQKAYNAYAGILKREAENAFHAIDELRDGPISMPKDQEWIHFVTHDNSFVDPNIPLRSAQYIHYPGRDHVAAQEIRAGLLERKSKYLKSYTAGWYVLSTTHLHEFKSADKGQAPVMSLYLPEQKLGSHSSEGGSSNKFILKGRQTGSMHRGHTWVFRAESHDTMMAWYEDIKTLTETTPEERSHFVRSHSRSLSQSSRRSASSDGMLDEDDEEPFSASSQIDVNPNPKQDAMSRRSQPGGRFPSDIRVNAQRGLQAPHSPSSVGSGVQEQPQGVATTAGLPAAAYIATDGSGQDYSHEHERPGGYGAQAGTPIDNMPSQAAIANHEAQQDGVNPYTSESINHTQPTHYQDNVYVAPIVTGQYQPEQQTEYYNQATDNASATHQDQTVPQAGESGDLGRAANGGSSGLNVMAVNTSGVPKSEPQLAHEMEAPVPVSEDGSLLADTPNVDTPPARPVDRTARTESVQTISNLHIPGEYPRNSIA